MGFEPTIPFWGIHTFQACAFDHSATSPFLEGSKKFTFLDFFPCLSQYRTKIVINTYNSKFEWAINTLTRRYYGGWVEHGHYDDYVTNIECPDCNGYRLGKGPLSVFLNGKHISFSALHQVRALYSSSWFSLWVRPIYPWKSPNIPCNAWVDWTSCLSLSAHNRSIERRSFSSMSFCCL